MTGFIKYLYKGRQDLYRFIWIDMDLYEGPRIYTDLYGFIHRTPGLIRIYYDLYGMSTMHYNGFKIYVDVYEKNQIYMALYVSKRRNNTHARKVTTDSRVNMRIGITAGQNDERGDQGLARTVDKNR